MYRAGFHRPGFTGFEYGLVARQLFDPNKNKMKGRTYTMQTPAKFTTHIVLAALGLIVYHQAQA
ncbi:MAG: hypothetical protein ACRESN_13965, partial [Pseudomonas sp.]